MNTPPGGKRYDDWLPRATLADRINELCEEHHMVTRSFPGVSAATISRIQRGYEPSLRAVVLIAKAFGMTVSELLHGVDLSEYERIEDL